VDPVIATVVDPEGKESLLAYSKFKPDSPEKFSKDIDGIVISHSNNNLEPNTGYKIKLAFKNGHVSQETLQDVLPVSPIGVIDVPKTSQSVHMYAYSYRDCKWVPLPVDQRLMVEP
jgi:hypothetical protein